MTVMDALTFAQSMACDLAVAHTVETFRSREHRSQDEHNSIVALYMGLAIEQAERAEAIGWLIDNLPKDLADKTV